jgi:two-component system nitrogen regulation response regulator GlnG
MAEIWVVDDDRSVRFVLAEALRADGYAVREFERAAQLQAALARQVPNLIFTDVRMPETDGLQLLESLKTTHPALPVIVMSAWTDVPSTAGAFRGGALDFLSKPFDLDAAVAMARRALQDARVAAPAPDPAPDEAELLGDSPAMRELFRAVGRLAQAPLSVLVTGETGTGKELVARALHRHSPRAKRPFVALNTAAIPAELLESELFGHEAGAFTGAARRHVGRFEQADGGTLFLDEIGDMPASLQTRLLRVLAEGEFFRVGGRELIRVDVRVIAATHQDLDAHVADGRFRADLLHRLDVVRLALPPLRARREDIAALAQRFLAQATQRLGVAPKRFAPEAVQRLLAHDWPGNVRELENLCWRLAALAPGERVLAGDLPFERRDESSPSNDWEAALRRWAEAELAAGHDGLHASATARLEQVLFDAALAATGGHRQNAAARLGLGRNTLTRKLRGR